MEGREWFLQLYLGIITIELKEGPRTERTLMVLEYPLQVQVKEISWHCMLSKFLPEW